jgi:hypothetical protein
MNVIITQCSSDEYWYKNGIGMIFDVYDDGVVGKYRVCGQHKYILEEDCERRYCKDVQEKKRLASIAIYNEKEELVLRNEKLALSNSGLQAELSLCKAEMEKIVKESFSFEARRNAFMVCKNCKWRNKNFYCTNDNICETYSPHGFDIENTNNSFLVYDYQEGGGFKVGDNFGCVHFEAGKYVALPEPELK